MNYAILILALGCAPLLPLVATGYFWFARWKCRKVAVSSGLAALIHSAHNTSAL